MAGWSFAELDIVSVSARTGAPTSGDHHGYRSGLSCHRGRLGRRQSRVPFSVIALWLGHESTTTTHRYVEADLAMKEKALARLEAPDTQDGPLQGAGLAAAIPADAVTMRRSRRLEQLIAAGPAPSAPSHVCIVLTCA